MKKKVRSKPKPKAVAKEVRRVVLGTGHPWFEKYKPNKVGYQKLFLVKEFKALPDVLDLNIHDLSGSRKIRLIAEILD